MKEAFGLIRKRIEEITVDRKIHGSITGCNMGICEDDDCLKCLQKKVLSIVSEVEAEYGNGCEKQTYEICLNGCDDDTTFKMDLTESEYHFLSRVSELANKTSTYGCMPRLYVREYTPTTD